MTQCQHAMPRLVSSSEVAGDDRTVTATIISFHSFPALAVFLCPHQIHVRFDHYSVSFRGSRTFSRFAYLLQTILALVLRNHCKHTRVRSASSPILYQATPYTVPFCLYGYLQYRHLAIGTIQTYTNIPPAISTRIPTCYVASSFGPTKFRASVRYPS